jgi:transposase
MRGASMTTEMAYIGIDISKDKFHVALQLSGSKATNAPKQRAFSNNGSGCGQLYEWLERQGVCQLWACLEATSTYGELVAETLHAAGYQVSVVNPSRVKAYSQSELRRVKTDKADAQLILRFCLTQTQQQQLDLWQPLAPEIKALRELVRRLEALQDLQQQEKNRLETATATTRESIQTIVQSLATEIQRIRDLIHEHIDQHPQLKAQRDLLTSIPGIGTITAQSLLAEIPDWTVFKNARQLVAYAGLNPQECRSGTSVQRKVRLSRLGNARLRKALYFPALTAQRFNPLIQPFCQRLRDRGKVKMQVVGAAMRKLLHLVFGVMKSQKGFDPNYLDNLNKTA